MAGDTAGAVGVAAVVVRCLLLPARLRSSLHVRGRELHVRPDQRHHSSEGTRCEPHRKVMFGALS